jgi:hypothetical protein
MIKSLVYSVIIKGMTPAIISKLPPGDPKILIMYSGIPAGKGLRPRPLLR